MWTEGYHCKKDHELARTNDKLEALEGELTTEQSQIAFAKFLSANPTFAANILTGVEIYPFQDIMIRAMSQKDFVLSVCGRGLSKSFTAAMFALLYAIFNPGTKIGICSSSFRQCLRWDSLVWTNRGNVMIKDAVVGDCVISDDFSINKVIDKWENSPSELLELVTGGGNSIVGKPEHMILVEDLGGKRFYKELKSISTLDCAVIQSVENRETITDTITGIKKLGGQDITYDITVENNPSYHAQGFINHNSRAVFKQIETFANGPKGGFLRQCIVGRPVHLPDAWEMTIGSSTVVAIPLGSGQKIRGYRFNVMIIDELLLLSDTVINEVLQPFMAIQADPVMRENVKKAEDKLIAAGEMKEEDRYHFKENKMIGLTSASYEFEYLFTLYQSYKDSILDPKARNVSHCIMQFSYEMAPAGLYSEAAIENAKKTTSESQFAREYRAQFTGDSAGYYSARIMEERTIRPGDKPCTEIVGDPDAEYILAIDPNYNDAESADHFAMCLLKLEADSENATMVHGYALSKSSLQKRAHYMKYLTDNFNIVYVILDSAGGKKFIEDIAELGVLNERLRLFEHDFDNSNWEEGAVKSRGEFRPEEGRICHAQIFANNWIRNANENLQVGLEQGKIWFASAVDAASESEFDVQKKARIPIGDLDFVKEDADNMTAAQKVAMKMSDFIEHQGYLVKLTKEETSLIVITQTTNGNQRFDLPSEILRDKSKPDRVRKDSYSALLLASWGLKCYHAMKKIKPKNSVGFVPRFIA